MSFFSGFHGASGTSRVFQGLFILHWQPVVFWDNFQCKCFDGQGWIIPALQVVWRLWPKWACWVGISPSAFRRYPGIALCGHAGCGDAGTLIGAINLVVKSSTKFLFYTDAWICKIGLFFFFLPFKFVYLSSPAISQSMPVNMYGLNRWWYQTWFSLCLFKALPGVLTLALTSLLNYWLFFSSFSRIQRLSLGYCLAISTGIRRSWWRGKQPL